MLQFDLDEESIVIRPSRTKPNLKTYLDLWAGTKQIANCLNNFVKGLNSEEICTKEK